MPEDKSRIIGYGRKNRGHRPPQPHVEDTVPEIVNPFPGFTPAEKSNTNKEGFTTGSEHKQGYTTG